LIAIRLNIHDAELPVFVLAMGGHGPPKADGVIRHGYIGMVAGRHQDSIAVSNDSHKFRIFGIGINELNTERRAGHVEIDIHLLEHDTMFVGWPTGPVARVGECETEEKPARLDVFSDDDVDLPLLAGSASLKLREESALTEV
jgi:hypothetical protein